MKDFKEKEFQEIAGGNYDSYGFYRTLNGSFWDPDGVYFNKEGLDKHGGKYDNNFEYIPGPGWIEEFMCYEDEKDNYVDDNDHGDKDEYGELEELYGNIDYDELMDDQFGIHPNKRSDNYEFEDNNYGNNRGNHNRHSYNNQQHNYINHNQNYQQNHHQNIPRNSQKTDIKKQNDMEYAQGSIFNKIPQEMSKNLKEKESTIQENNKKEIILKADDLFGGNDDLFLKMDKKEVNLNYQGFKIQTIGNENEQK